MRRPPPAALAAILALAGGCDDPVVPDRGSSPMPVTEWRLENRAYHNFRDVSASAGGGVAAVGNAGTLFRLIDGEWTEVDAPLSDTPEAVWSAGPSELFAVSYTWLDYNTPAGIHRYRDGEWTTWELDALCRPMDIWGASSDAVFVVTRCRGGVFQFDGSEWRQIGDHLGWAIHGRAADDVYVAGGTREALHYDGTAWTPLTLEGGADMPSVWDVWAAPSGQVWFAASTLGAVWFDGTEWRVVDPGAGPDADYGSVWGSGDEVFLGGWGECPANGPCAGIVSRFDGSTWSSTALPRAVVAISGTGPDDVWAVGLDGRIFHYDGSGWTTVREGLSRSLHAVRGGSGGTLHAVGPFTVLRHGDSGWTEVLSSAELPLEPRGIWLDDDDDVLVVGHGDQPVLHMNGAGWTSMASPAADLNAVWGAPGGDVFAVGDHGVVVRYDGSGWTAMGSPTGTQLVDVWGASATDVFAVGVYDPGQPDWPGILRFDGQTWEGSILSRDVSHSLQGAWGSGPDDVFAVGRNGLILHWNGEAWREHDSGTSADLMDVWGDAPDNVFAVGAEGTVIHYDGRAWSPVALPFSVRGTLHGVWLDEGSDVVMVGDAGVIVRGVR